MQSLWHRRHRSMLEKRNAVGKKKENETPEILVVGDLNNSDTIPDAPANCAEFHMCKCGLMHTDSAVVSSSHNSHHIKCELYNKDCASSVPINKFKSAQNKQLLRRKKHNTRHLEESAFAWVSRWIQLNKSWPAEEFPWIQWALNKHPESQFIWCATSTPKNISARSEDFAIRHSRSRNNFEKKRTEWWSENARVMLPLNNRAFKPVSSTSHVFYCEFVLCINCISDMHMMYVY